MSSFPSSQEKAVASALLLLSTTPPSLSPPRFNPDPDDLMPQGSTNNSCRKSLMSTGSRSSSSSSSDDDGPSEKIGTHRIKLFSATARYREMKFKIVKRSRSKIIWTSGSQKPNTGIASMVSTGSVSTEASSCLSSSSSGISCARSVPDADRAGGEHAKCLISSAHLRRRAEAILKLLSVESSSEVRIRQLLGDSPDTSKALRMLLRLKEVKRSGTGGRHDPFLYTISE